MDRNLPDIEKLFKSALEDEQEMPAPEVWTAIDNILDKDNVISIKKKYEDVKKVAFLLFFMLLGLSIYEFAEPLGNRNNNFSGKEIVSEKSNGENVKDESNISSNKLDGSRRSTINKSKGVADNSLVFKEPAAKAEKTESSSVLTEGNKRARDDKRTIFNTKLLQPKQIAADNSIAAVKNEISKEHKEKFGTKDMKLGKTVLSKDYNALSAEILKPINLDSINPIILPRSPAPIKIAPGIANKNSMAVSTKTIKGKLSAFSINLFFSPDLAFYRLRDNVSNNNPGEATEIEKNEHHEFSLTTGALIEYRATKHWSIQSGLTYSNTNITVAPKTIYAQADNSGSIKYLLNTSSGYGYVLPSFSNNPKVGDSLYAFTSTHTLQYLSLPVAIKYIITKGKISFSAMAGAAVNRLIKGKIETSVEDGINNEPEVTDNLQGLKKVYWSGLAGFGINYQFYKKAAITFAPVYRFALNSNNKDASVKSYPNSIGLTTGIKFDF